MTAGWIRPGLLLAGALSAGVGLGSVALGQEQGQIRVTGQGAAPAQPPPAAVQQIPRTPPVDLEKHDQGKELWAKHCIDCHGTQARGSVRHHRRKLLGARLLAATARATRDSRLRTPKRTRGGRSRSATWSKPTPASA